MRRLFCPFCGQVFKAASCPADLSALTSAKYVPYIALCHSMSLKKTEVSKAAADDIYKMFNNYVQIDKFVFSLCLTSSLKLY